MKKLNILGSALLALPLFLASCSSDACRTCDCSLQVTTTTTPDGGTPVSDTENPTRSFTACDSDVNNPHAASWEYYDSNPTTREEFTVNQGTNSERTIVETTEYDCSCED